MLEIDFSELQKFGRNLQDKSLAPFLHNGLITSITLAEREAKIESPIKTGRLRKSYFTKVSNLEARLENNVEYFNALHGGVKPFTIIPNTKKALYWQGATHPIKKINHPGIKANPIYERVIEKIEDPIIVILNKEIGKFLQTLKV